MKIAIVVQRYGAEINGGAELHARYIAERLAQHVEVEVLTTCASDYITWRNALPAGTETVQGVTVRRFPVARERDPDDFGRHSRRVFTRAHSLQEELAWLEAEGPTSPALIAHIRATAAEFDFFIFFSFRYYHSYYGVRAVAAKSILVPTAERDGALGLSLFGPVFRSTRALMYNSLEERALIHAVANNAEVPGVVVGVGSDVPAQSSGARFRQKFNLRDRFAIYIGRIDENKGCAELFRFFQQYASASSDSMHLVLIGNPVLPIPQHPLIHHLGFVSDQDKFDALAAAELLIMPSYFESLSMVALEAWALGKPVLANGHCDVLKGQCIRSNGGLYYESYPEFFETLRAIDFHPTLAAALGRNGREYFHRHYAWPIIERKYLDMLDRLKREPVRATVDPLPGWFARRRRTLPAADEVVAQLPKGAVRDERRASTRAEGERAERHPPRDPVAEHRGRPERQGGDRTERRGRDRAQRQDRDRTEGQGFRPGQGEAEAKASALRTDQRGGADRRGDRRPERGAHQRRRRPGRGPQRRPGGR